MARGGWSVVILVALLAPGGLAQGSPIEGEVAFAGPPWLEGEARFERGTALELGREGPAAFSLSWARAEGRRVLQNYTGVDGVPVIAGVVDPRVEREPLRFGAGEIRDLRCHAPCNVFLVPLGPGPGLALQARVRGSPALFLEEHLTYAGMAANTESSFEHRTPEGAWRVARGVGGVVEAGNASLALPPRVGLVLVNATFLVAAEGRERAFDTRTRWDDAALGPVSMRVERAPHVYLELEGAALVLGPTAGFDLHLDAPALRVAGTVGPATATGWVAEDGRRRDLRGHALLVEGDVRLDALPTGDVLGPGASAFAVSGAGRVVVDGLRVAPQESRGASSLTVAAAFLALLALLARALLPLYSRIDRARALGHPSRRRILDALAAAPGATVDDLRAATGLGRAAVEHHLRMLAMHGLVAVARKGRRRRFHRYDAPPLGQDARRLLADGTRRRIAGILAPGRVLTQGDLAAEAGVSKRLVCYHLSRLAEAGLVEPVPGRPPRYAGTLALRGLLEGGGGPTQA